MNITAKLISYVFHPIFMLFYSTLMFFNVISTEIYSYPTDVKTTVSLVVFAITVLIPVLLNFLFYKRKLISSLEMHEREERTLPYIIACIFYFVAYNLLHQLRLPPFFTVFALGSSILTLCVLIINARWKISAHLTGIGALLGGVIAYYLLYNAENLIMIPIIIMISGIIGFARLQLQAHTPVQIYTGFALGSGGMFLLMYFWGS
jgi:hypothetical protein